MSHGTCPNCGADLPPRARACPECGSDERTGWSDEAQTDRLGLPGEEFDYDEFMRREFGQGKPRGLGPAGRPLWHWIVAAALLLALLAWWVF